MFFLYLNLLHAYSPAYSPANKGNKSSDYSFVLTSIYSKEMGCWMGKRVNLPLDDIKAAIGIGAMIVFIAMVLIAGIAASVFVQTANKLEITGMESGSQTSEEVSSGIRIIDIEGQKDDRTIGGTLYDTRIHNMTMTVASRAGSPSIDLSQAVLEISNSTVKNILVYNSEEPKFSENVPDDGVFNSVDGANSIFDQGANTFGLIELEDADNSCDADAPVINRGDMVMMTINLSACFNGCPSRTDVWGTILPEGGAVAIFEFRVPGLGSDTVYDLY